MKQVEKSLEMKKCSRNGTAKIKKTRYRKVHNVNSHTSMLDGFYLMAQYQRECGNIEGHAYSVSFVQHFKTHRRYTLALSPTNLGEHSVA